MREARVGRGEVDDLFVNERFTRRKQKLGSGVELMAVVGYWNKTPSRI